MKVFPSSCRLPEELDLCRSWHSHHRTESEPGEDTYLGLFIVLGMDVLLGVCPCRILQVKDVHSTQGPDGTVPSHEAPNVRHMERKYHKVACHLFCRVSEAAWLHQRLTGRLRCEASYVLHLL